VTIAPPSDVVLGVALAADPDAYRAAAERLQRMSKAANADLEASTWRASVSTEGAAPSAGRLAAAPGPSGAARQGRPGPDAFAQLEAFVLQTFIQSMLPKNATHVFGKGTAGEVWKSMLAEKLSGEIARSGQVGIAKHLQSAAGPGASITGIPGAAAVPPSPSLASVLPYLRDVSSIGPALEKEKS
jgi:peptidoglycan hydrolase FlgJ